MGAVALSRLVAVALAGIAMAAALAALLFIDYFGPFVILSWSLGAFAAVGLVVALLRPRHPVGWLFLVAGTCYLSTMTASAWTWSALVGAPGSLPGGELAAWLANALWIPAVTCTLLGIALFPNGRPPSRAWRPVLATLASVLAITGVVTALVPTTLSLPAPLTAGLGVADSELSNPLRPALIADALVPLVPITDLVPVPAFLVTLWAVVVRFRRSSGVERQQLKWFALGAAASIVMLTASLVVPVGVAADAAWGAGMISWGLVPIATGIAILRHRLFDIDVVIRRTVVYGLVVAVLGASYAGLVVALQTLFSGMAGGTLPVAFSTLAIAALFAPVRARVQALVDRKFYRARYDAQQTIQRFGSSLRDEVELRSVGDLLLTVARGAVQPRSARRPLRQRATR